MTPSERLAQLDAGDNPALILKMPSGFAVMGDSQFFPGYCLLLAYPQVDHLTDLDLESRSRFLIDMSILGDSVKEVTGCKRINYSIYGNLDPFLHAHIWPRYTWEDPSYATLPPFNIPSDLRSDPAKQFSLEEHRPLMQQLARSIQGRL